MLSCDKGKAETDGQLDMQMNDVPAVRELITQENEATQLYEMTKCWRREVSRCKRGRLETSASSRVFVLLDKRGVRERKKTFYFKGCWWGGKVLFPD